MKRTCLAFLLGAGSLLLTPAAGAQEPEAGAPPLSEEEIVEEEVEEEPAPMAQIPAFEQTEAVTGSTEIGSRTRENERDSPDARCTRSSRHTIVIGG